MDPMTSVQQDRGLLRWGGLAGLLGGALMLFVFVFVGAVVGPEPTAADGPVGRFPEIRAARTLENSLYLVVMALWMIQLVAVSRALLVARLAPALFGGVLGVAGLTILAAGALPHIATTRLAGLYHAAGATAQDRATIVLLWQANQGIFDALLAAGLVLLPLGLVSLGVAMRGSPAFGKRLARATVVLGGTGIAAAAVFLLDPLSPIVAVGFLALLALHLVLGWWLYRLSSAASPAPATLAGLRATGIPLS